MANEIKINLSLSLSKGGSTEEMSLIKEDITMTGDNFLHNKQTIGTSAEALVVGDVGTGGWFFAANRDPTNFVTIFDTADEATALVKILAGEGEMFRANVAPFAKADTADVLLEYFIVDA